MPIRDIYDIVSHCKQGEKQWLQSIRLKANWPLTALAVAGVLLVGVQDLDGQHTGKGTKEEGSQALTSAKSAVGQLDRGCLTLQSADTREKERETLRRLRVRGFTQPGNTKKPASVSLTEGHARSADQWMAFMPITRSPEMMNPSSLFASDAIQRPTLRRVLMAKNRHLEKSPLFVLVVVESPLSGSVYGGGESASTGTLVPSFLLEQRTNPLPFASADAANLSSFDMVMAGTSTRLVTGSALKVLLANHLASGGN